MRLFTQTSGHTGLCSLPYDRIKYLTKILELLLGNTHRQRQLVISIPRLSGPSIGQNKCYRNILLYVTSVISIMVGHFDCKHSCLIEKNICKAFIFPNRWQDAAESLGIEITSCLCLWVLPNSSSDIFVKYLILSYCKKQSPVWPEVWVKRRTMSIQNVPKSAKVVSLEWWKIGHSCLNPTQNCLRRLYKIAQMAINWPIWSHWNRPILTDV